MDNTNNQNSIISRFKNKAKEILSLIDYIDTDAASNNIRKDICFQGPTVYILAFAIVIASVGLNVNSIPVIIGAMLISPLMGPIIGIGYSLGINDLALLKKAAYNLLIMVAISIISSSLYFILSPLRLDNPSELLARTSPTIFDVLIALFGGFAGIVEISRKEKGTVFAGVAIATALMPPLCTVGYGIATGEFQYIIGALYLFFINSVFIALATFFTVKYLKYPKKSFADPVRQKKVTSIITFVTIIMIIPSIFSAVMVIKENRFNQIAKSFVSDNTTLVKSYIYDYQVKHSSKSSVLEVSIAGEALSETDMEMLLRSAEKYGLKREQVIVKQNAATVQKDITDKAVVQSIFERHDTEIKEREGLIAEMEKELKVFKDKELPSDQMAREILAQYPGLTSFSIARGAEVNPTTLDSTEQIIVIIKGNKLFSAKEIEKLQKWLTVRLGFNNIKIVQEK